MKNNKKGPLILLVLAAYMIFQGIDRYVYKINDYVAIAFLIFLLMILVLIIIDPKKKNKSKK